MQDVEVTMTEETNLEYLSAFLEEVDDKEITVEQVDTAIKVLAQLKEEYETKKDAASLVHSNYEKQQNTVIELLTKIGKTSFKLEGVGTVTKKASLVVQTPKTIEEKALLFKWLKDNLGAEGFLSYASVNSQSLNSLYNTMFEEADDKMNFKIDGVGEPTERITLSFRRGK